jgi:hypothetical protein
MGCILSLQYFGHSQQTELIFHGIYPFFGIQWLYRFLEDRWPGVHKKLEIAVLIRLMSTLV